MVVVASVIHENLIGLDTSTRLVLPAKLSKAAPKAQASTTAPSPGSALHAAADSAAASAQRATLLEEEEQSAASAEQEMLRPSAPPPTSGARHAANAQRAAAQEWAFNGIPTDKKSELQKSRAAPAIETVQAPPARLDRGRVRSMGRVWESGSDEDAGEDEEQDEEEEEPAPQPPKRQRRLLQVLDIFFSNFGTFRKFWVNSASRRRNPVPVCEHWCKLPLFICRSSGLLGKTERQSCAQLTPRNPASSSQAMLPVQTPSAASAVGPQRRPSLPKQVCQCLSTSLSLSRILQA